MNLITYPLNNIDYTAEDAELFHCTRKSGIWAKNSFMIFVNENKVTIGRGIVWINNKEFSGKVAAMKSSETIDMGIAPSTNPRIDVIALQFNANNNATALIYKKGKESVSPVMPEIQRDSALYEFYLCRIYRRVGATSITWNDVTDLRFNESLCGLMADSITQVDTSAINAQISAFIERFNTQTNTEIAKLQESIESVKNTSGFMFTSDWVEDDVIPVRKGGTGAKTEAEIRSLLGVGVEKIWTNDKPNEEFPARVKAFHNSELKKFDKFIVEFKVSTSIDRSVFFMATEGTESSAHWIENVHVGGKLRICGRLFRTNPLGIIFDDAHEKDIDATSVTVNNKKLIPLSLYGIVTH